MRLLLLVLLSFLCINTATAQDGDEALWVNWGFNAGWNYGKPTYPGLDAFKERFDAETAFKHDPLQPGTLTSGGALGLSFFSGHSAVSFDYQALGLISTYSMETTAGEGLKDYSFKLYQHTGRWSYGYGIPWAKYGVCGIYAGAGIYFGTWDVKLKKPLDEKMKSTNIEDLKGFSLGISPELTLRLFFVEIKAFYDYPFLKTDLAPVYDYLYGTAGAASASGDSRLKSSLSNLGVCATVFIPFGKPSPATGNSRRSSGSANDRDAQERQQMNRDSERNRKSVEENEKQIQEYQKNNDRQREQERRDQYYRR